MLTRDFFSHNLAAAFLAGAWSRRAILCRAIEACGSNEPWLRSLVRAVLTRFPANTPRPDPQILARLIGAKTQQPLSRPLCRVYWLVPQMNPAAGTPAAWQLPALTTTGALADWLGLTPGELDWFADCQGRAVHSPAGPLRHYTYQWLIGRAGKRRLLEIPKPRLKDIQRRLLDGILNRLDPHDAVHGFRRGRSVRTYGAPHAGKRIVIRFDLRAFFPSIPAAHIHFDLSGQPARFAAVRLR